MPSFRSWVVFDKMITELEKLVFMFKSNTHLKRLTIRTKLLQVSRFKHTLIRKIFCFLLFLVWINLIFKSL